MAELGLAIVSLGLQVCEGIHTYIDGIKSRDMEVGAVRKLANDLAAILASTQSLLHREDSNTLLTGPHAIHSIQLCDERIKALDKLGHDLAGQQLSSLPGIRRRAKEAIKRLEYPFKRDGLIRLREELRQSWEVVQAAVQSLTLNISIGIKAAVENVDSTLSTIATHNLPRIESQGEAIVSQATAMSISSRDAHETTQQMIRAVNARLDALVTSTNSEDAMALLLLENPDLLRNLCNQTLPQDHPVRTRTSIQEAKFPSLMSRKPYYAPVSTCTCAAFATRRNGRFSWGPFYFFNRTQVTEHLESCPVSAFSEPSVSRQYTALMAGVPARLLRRALEIRLSFTGSTSFSTQIRSYNIIDVRVSPSFGIIRCLTNAFDEFRRDSEHRAVGTRSHWSDRENRSKNVETFCTSVFPHAMKLLTRCFVEGLASPRDVDESNNNLLHEVARLACEIYDVFEYKPNGGLKKAYADLSRLLISFRVEVDLCNREGSQPVRVLTEDNYRLTPSISMITPLLPQTYDDIVGGPLPILYYRNCYAESIWTKFEYFLESLHLTDLFLGEFSRAILKRNYAFVEKELRRDPSAALRSDETTLTVPILFAFYDSRMLTFIMEHTAMSELRSWNVWGATLIGFALSYSSWINEKEGCDAESISSRCECTAPLRILLSGHFSVIPSADFWSLFFSEHDVHRNVYRYDNLFRKASLHAKWELGKALKRQTLQLFALAETELTPVEWEALGIGNTLCDSKVGQVCRKLRRHKVNLAPQLQLDRLHIAVAETTIEQPYSQSVFYEVLSVEDASLFESLGFCPAGSDEPCGPPKDCMRYDAATRVDVDYIEWLLERGGQLANWEWPRPCDHSSNDALMGNWLGRWLRYKRFVPVERYVEWWLEECESKEPGAFERLHDQMMHVDDSDSCDCFCSPKGCTSFVRMIKVLARQRTDIGNGRLDDLPHYLQYWDSRLQKRHHRVILRLFTFEALGIRHTCREIPYEEEYFREVFTILEDEEIGELHQEDSLRVSQLEKLLIEFEDMDWMRDAQDNEAPSTEDVLDFWKTRWRERIREARNEMRAISREAEEEPNVKGGEVDIDWEAESVSSNDSSLVSYVRQPDSPCACDACEAGMGDRFAEYWMSEMDKLVP